MNLIGIIILCAVIADFLLHFIADCLNLGKLGQASAAGFCRVV